MYSINGTPPQSYRCHMPCGITQGYLPPNIRQHTLL